MEKRSTVETTTPFLRGAARLWMMIAGIIAVLLFAGALALLKGKSITAFSGSGTGTSGDPFQITTCAQLQEMNNSLDASYRLMNDIDCTGVNFTPIGLSSDFTGNFDGDGWEITNLSLTVNTTATGLFANTVSASIYDVTLTNVQITKSSTSNGNIGALVGHMNSGTVTNCSASGDITQTFNDYYTESVGGLIGYADGGATISFSSAAVNINMLEGLYGAGGFIGETRGTVVIQESHASGSVQGGIDSYFNGGFVGWQVGNSEIYGSYATGNVHMGIGATGAQGDNYDHGGFVGGIGGNGSYLGTTRIEECYATGNVIIDGESNYNAGGFAGTVYDGGTVTRSYSTGSVTYTGGWGNDIGGFAGLTRNRYSGADPEISQSYASGTVTASSKDDVSGVGGFIGEHRHGTIADSYTRSAIIITAPEPTASDYANDIAGFAGEMSAATITNSYAANTMTINTPVGQLNNIGGFGGYNQGTGVVISSYWDTTTSGQSTSATGSGLATAAMNTESSFTGWDFSTIWDIQPYYNNGYPVFIFLIPTSTPTSTPTTTPTATSTPSGTGTTTGTPTSTTTTTGTSTPTATVSTSITVTGTPVPTGTPTLVVGPTLPPVTNTEGSENNGNEDNLATIEGCPQFVSFRVSSSVVEKGEQLTFSWETKNATRVIWSGFESNLAVTGEKTVVPNETFIIRLVADNGNCNARVEKQVSVVETVPWTNSTTIGASVLIVEAAVVQVLSLYGGVAGGALATSHAATVHGNMWLALAGILDRKRRKSYGVVYDSVTKMPIARAVVRLKDLKNNKVVDTIVTDAKGIMRLSTHPGDYAITVTHPQYSFPSTSVSGPTDGGYANVYTGSKISILSSTQNTAISIPLDPVKLTEAQKRKIKTRILIERFANYGSLGLLLGGLAYSGYASVIYPHLFNYLAVMLYILILSAKLYLLYRPHKTMGIVTDENGVPLDNVEFGLFDPEFKNLLYRTFTTEDGEYNFVVDKGNYYLKVMDSRYTILEKGQPVKAIFIEAESSAKDAISYLSGNVTLREGM